MPDPTADAYAGKRRLLSFEADDVFNPDLVRVKAERAMCEVYWYAGDAGPDDAARGWYYTTQGEASGPFDTSREAWESAIGW
jgi:hypothetical protein